MSDTREIARAEPCRNMLRPDEGTEGGEILYDAFKAGINALTIQETGSTEVENWIRLSETKPFRTEHRAYLQPASSVLSKIVGEATGGGFELAFAAFLDKAPDVQSFAKNYLAVGFKLDYVKANGDLSNYIPDFIVRDANGTVWVVETKGREEIDLPHKMARLGQWCADATAAAENGTYRFLYVDQPGFEKHKPGSFADLASSFSGFQPPELDESRSKLLI
ncbi:MAG: hypothetical protein ACT443_06520 [Gemmatimonadota bacterium]